ncbi:DUF3018 family protein [Allosaccharopolyspora coralli]|uniref:DUF3018 family protein n=1 Tax=Allosaccharopolyspora coralli TaxID=2665642 RepID=A0A5Q3Q4M2_9PSEU|nr:antitoxin MazE family protein [Allosaccharopolyspora coralli]QGK68446.1 DUF3018 family protein [Allosaccharopolyspora coralli]
MTSRARVHEYRQRLRAQGLRPVQIWVPDSRSASFTAAAHAQSLAVAASEHADGDQGFVEALAWDIDEAGE